MLLFYRACILIAVAALLPSASTLLAEVHCRRTLRRCCIPKHNYGHDNERFGATEYAVANPAVIGTSTVRKPFHFRATKLEVDHLLLDQVGLALVRSKGSSNASLAATGRITHDGGDGGLTGNNVTIRMRAFVAADPDVNQVPPDAFVVWRCEHHLWVPRGQKHINLVPALVHLPQLEKLAIYFDEITHLEVEMEYRRDR